jgi:hypothetical protein
MLDIVNYCVETPLLPLFSLLLSNLLHITVHPWLSMLRTDEVCSSMCVLYFFNTPNVYPCLLGLKCVFTFCQVMSEIQNPIQVELGSVISGRRGIICETVHSEFKELVLMCGGPNEKFRANQLLKCLM